MKNKIAIEYSHFSITEYSCNLYIVDFTKKSKALSLADKKAVEVHTVIPSDIESFIIKNPNKVPIGVTILNNKSFVDNQNKPLTQCECISFPNTNSVQKTWILFLELKYCKRKNQIKHLKKAKEQVFETMKYFKTKNIIENNQICYLIVSLPQQNNAPFENFIMTPSEIIHLKLKEKIIFRGVNEISIKDEYYINV